LWVIIIVQDGFGRLCLHREPRLQVERKSSAVGSRPQVEDYAIRLDFVALQIPARISDGRVQRGAVYVRSRRQSHFSQHHAATSKTDAFGMDRTTYRVPSRDHRVLATRPSIRAIRYVGQHQILREGSLISPVTFSFSSFYSCRASLVGILPKRILGLPLRASG
jgi:hypothetical protein